MEVFMVEKVVDQEYGNCEVVAIFAKESDAKAYVSQEVKEKYDNEPNYYPWFDKSGKGLPIFHIKKMGVR